MRNSILVLLLLSGIRLHAQNTILVGKVFSQDSLPVQGAKVSIVGVDADVTTSSGEFKLTIPSSFNLKAGDKITCFVEPSGRSAGEYSVFIPKNSLLNPLIIRIASKETKDAPHPESLVFSVTTYYDDPYGEAFYMLDNKLVKVRCLPAYYHEVHMAATVNNTNLQLVDDMVKEAYRAVLSNAGSDKLIISDVRMQLTDYRPVPARYVVNWLPKGLKKAISTEVSLDPNTKTYKSLKKDEYLELQPDESQIVLFDIKNGAPGIYTLTFEADVLKKDGSYEKQMALSTFQIMIPDRAKNKGILLVDGYQQDILSDRLLKLDEKKYAKLIEGSNPASIYVGTVFADDNLQKISDDDLSQKLLKKK